MPKSFLYFIFSLLPSGVFAQSFISGRVLSHADHKPVPNADVFLSNTSIGGHTDNDGTFTLSNIKPGKYDLVISIVGFETYNQTITVLHSDFALGDIEILPRALQLNEVKIKAQRETAGERALNLSLFKAEFLGLSKLAAHCKIVNPNVLRLHYDKEAEKLTASTNEFLVVENPDLGYRIKYLLNSFAAKYVAGQTASVQFEGPRLFEEMQGPQYQQQEWKKRRLDVYKNSAMHFLRAALKDQISEEGFRVTPLEPVPNPQRAPDSLIKVKIKFFDRLTAVNDNYSDSLAFWEKQSKLPQKVKDPLNKADIIRPTNQQGVYAIRPPDHSGGLRVDYNEQHHFSAYINDNSTVLKFTNAFAFFDDNGIVIIDPTNMAMAGRWGNNRVAELLPDNYEPGL